MNTGIAAASSEKSSIRRPGAGMALARDRRLDAVLLVVAANGC